MEIKYTKIIIEGFQSISQQMVFKLDRVGLNLIRGANGIGKSTMLNAILYAEFGIDTKDGVATWEDSRHEEYRGTRVVIERIIGDKVYRVARHLEFKGKTTGLSAGDKLMIFCKGIDEPKFTAAHLVAKGQHKSDMQELIDQQLGATAKTYTNAIFFAQRMPSLATSKDADKRVLFDTLFDSSFLDAYKAAAKLKQTELEEATNELLRKQAANSSTLASKRDKLESDTKIIKDFEIEKAKRVTKAELAVTNQDKTLAETKTLVKSYNANVTALSVILSEDILTLESEKSKYDVQDALYTTSVDKCKELEKTIQESKTKEDRLTKSLDTISDSCLTCNQKASPEAIKSSTLEVKSKIKAEEEVQSLLTKTLRIKETKKLEHLATRDQLYAGITALTVKITKDCKTFLDEGEKELTVSELVSTLTTKRDIGKANQKNAAARALTEKAHLDKLKLDLKAENEAKKPDLDLEDLKDTIKTCEKLEEEYTKDLSAQDAELTKVKWWVSKGFGSSGIKSFIFNSMLNRLNSYCYKYAARLGFRVEFSVDMTKDRKPFRVLIYKGDQIKSYKALSGGQQQRVDICISFAMHDFLTATTNINILVIDEILEGLDAQGVETVFELAREKAATKSVYCISHLSTIDVMGARIIEPTYSNERTTL